jgi:hypothetical protein
MPTTQVKHRCQSCGEAIPGDDREIGTCDHGLLCNICRYDNQCLKCMAAKREAEHFGTPEDLESERYGI